MPAAVQMPPRRDGRVRPRRDRAGRGQGASPRSGTGTWCRRRQQQPDRRLCGCPSAWRSPNCSCPITPYARQLICLSNDSLRTAQYRLAATAAPLPERQPLGLLPLPLVPGRQPAHVAPQSVCVQRPQFAPVDHRSWLGRPRLAFRRPAHFDLALSLPSEHLHCR